MKSYKIAVDENIMIKDEICTAGSKMLYNFKPPYSATVVDKIKNAGMTISYKSKIGEFTGVAHSQNEETAAYAVNNGLADAALGIDVDGVAYRSAVKNDIVYIKPTYGTVSRFGVVANVSSIDQIGVYAKNFDDGFSILSLIAGHDKNDGTSYPTEKYEYAVDAVDLKSLKVTKINNLCGDSEKSIEEKIKNTGLTINQIDFKYLDYLAQVYLIISSAEFSANISKYDGIKYGYRTENFKNVNDMITNSRSESFTLGTKIKSLMGTYVLSEEQFEKYYYKATQLRRLIKQELDEIFKQSDFIIMHISDFSSGSFNPNGYYNNLKFTALSNLTGCPSIVVPVSKQHGVQIMAKQFDENKLFALGKAIL